MKTSKSNGTRSGEPQSSRKKPVQATNSERKNTPAQTKETGHGPAESDLFKFRLYVAGSCPNSLEAEFNLRSLCREYLPECHEIEIVDVLREPERALTDKVSLTPQLVKLSPDPVQKIIGRLNLFEPILEALGLLHVKSARLLRANHVSKLQGRYDGLHANGFDSTSIS